MNNAAQIRSYSTLAVTTISLVLAASSLAAPVSIDAPQAEADTDVSRFGIGLTFSTTSRNYEGIDNQSARLPYILANWGDFYIEGLNLGYNFTKEEGFSWGLIAVPRFLGYSESNSPVLSGLDDTDYSYHGGISAYWRLDYGRFSVQALTDLLNESGGSEINATLSHSLSFGDLTLSPAVSVNWQDADLVDHYYGVTSAQATSDRDAYEGDSVVNTAVSLAAGYSISDKFRLIGQTRLDQFGGKIEESPLVDDNTTVSTTLGFVYTF